MGNRGRIGKTPQVGGDDGTIPRLLNQPRHIRVKKNKNIGKQGTISKGFFYSLNAELSYSPHVASSTHPPTHNGSSGSIPEIQADGKLPTPSLMSAEFQFGNP